jgi:hypothetical protein
MGSLPYVIQSAFYSGARAITRWTRRLALCGPGKAKWVPPERAWLVCDVRVQGGCVGMLAPRSPELRELYDYDALIIYP